MAESQEKNEFYTKDILDLERCKEILQEAASQPNDIQALSLKFAINFCKGIIQNLKHVEVAVMIEDLIATYEIKYLHGR